MLNLIIESLMYVDGRRYMHKYGLFYDVCDIWMLDKFLMRDNAKVMEIKMLRNFVNYVKCIASLYETLMS